MQSMGISKKAVNDQLKRRGISTADVFIMTIDTNGKAIIVREDTANGKFRANNDKNNTDNGKGEKK